MVRSITILALATAAFAVPLDLPFKGLGGLLGGGASANAGRDLVNVLAPVDATVKAVADAAAYVDGKVVANVANVGIANSDIASNDLNNNNVKIARQTTPDLSSLPEEFGDLSFLTGALQGLKARDLAEIEATLCAIVKVLVDLLVKARVDVKAAIANVKIANSSILSNILNNNNVKIARDLVDVYALVQAAVRALVQAAVKAGVDANVLLGNLNISCSQILSNDFDWNTIKVLSARGSVNILAVAVAIVKAVAQLCASIGINITALIGNVDIKYSKILTNLLNNNTVNVLSRDTDGVADVVVDLLAMIAALIQACLKANLNVVAALLNIGIDCSSILTNIGNGNNIGVLNRGLVDVLAQVTALVKAIIYAVVDVKADVLANILNIAIQNSSIGSNIANGNNVQVL